MESYLELGERLKEIRGNMGLSLEQVSALTGVSKTMLSQIESSKSIPTIATVFKIANGLKIKVDSLLCGEKKQYYDVININNLSPAIDNHEQVYMYCIFPFSPTTGFEIYYCIYKSGCDHDLMTVIVMTRICHPKNANHYLVLHSPDHHPPLDVT